MRKTVNEGCAHVVTLRRRTTNGQSWTLISDSNMSPLWTGFIPQIRVSDSKSTSKKHDIWHIHLKSYNTQVLFCLSAVNSCKSVASSVKFTPLGSSVWVEWSPVGFLLSHQPRVAVIAHRNFFFFKLILRRQTSFLSSLLRYEESQPQKKLNEMAKAKKGWRKGISEIWTCWIR